MRTTTWCLLPFGIDGLLLSQSRQRIICVNSLKTTLQVRMTRVGHLTKKYDPVFDSSVCPCLGHIHGNLQFSNSQYLHHSLPPSGVLALAELITMGTVNPQESYT